METPQTLDPHPKACTSCKQTIATRLHPEEILAIEAAAKEAGTDRSSWLREAALARLRGLPPVGRSADQTLLAEIVGLRCLLLNLFPAAIPSLPIASVMEIKRYADSIKNSQASNLMAHSR